jgi:hypothetical protein
MFFLVGNELSTCQTQNPDIYCQQLNMYWRVDGLLEVNLFFASLTNPTEWLLPDEAQFAVPGTLEIEGTWTNSFSVESWGVDTQTFSIVDPPESIPEPAAGFFAIVGLVALCLLSSSLVRIDQTAST